MRARFVRKKSASSSGTIGLKRPIASSAVQPKISVAPAFHERTRPVEVEVDDRRRGALDQRAMVLVGVLDLLELRCLLERRRRLVGERAQDLKPLGVRKETVDRVVRPDVADPAAATVVERHEEQVVPPRVRTAPVALGVVVRLARPGTARVRTRMSIT